MQIACRFPINRRFFLQNHYHFPVNRCWFVFPTKLFFILKFCFASLIYNHKPSKKKKTTKNQEGNLLNVIKLHRFNLKTCNRVTDLDRIERYNANARLTITISDTRLRATCIYGKYWRVRFSTVTFSKKKHTQKEQRTRAKEKRNNNKTINETALHWFKREIQYYHFRIGVHTTNKKTNLLPTQQKNIQAHTNKSGKSNAQKETGWGAT